MNRLCEIEGTVAKCNLRTSSSLKVRNSGRNHERIMVSTANLSDRILEKSILQQPFKQLYQLFSFSFLLLRQIHVFQTYDIILHNFFNDACKSCARRDAAFCSVFICDCLLAFQNRRRYPLMELRIHMFWHISHCRFVPVPAFYRRSRKEYTGVSLRCPLLP